MELFVLIFFSLQLLECHGKKVENIAIVDVKKERSFALSKQHCKKTLGGRLARGRTLDKHLSCLNETLDSSEKYWIGRGKDCSATGSNYCTFKLNSKKPEYKKQRSQKRYFSLCEVDLSTYKNKRRLCTSENSTKRPRTTPSMSHGDALTTVYQTASIPDAFHADRTITMVSMELSYDDKKMENIAIVNKKESFDTSKTHCKSLGGQLARRKSINEHLPCLKKTLDTSEQYWIGKDENDDKNESELKYSTFQLKESYFEPENSHKGYFSLCEVDLSTYKDKRRLCHSEKTTKGHRASMSDGDVLTSAYQTESITDRTTRIVKSREQSMDDGPSVEVIISVVFLLVVTFVVALTVFVKKRRKRKAIQSKNVSHDPNTLKPTEKAPVPESDAEQNHMLNESPYAEIKESVTGINQASVPNTIKPDETDPNILKPNEMVPDPVSVSTLYHILEESPYSEIKGSGAENFQNLQASECQEFPTRNNKDETYDHLDRNRSESRHGSEVDGAHPEIDNASDALLEDNCEVKTEKDYDHLELKEQSSNIKVFSEYSMTDDATRINKDETYDHLERNKSESRHGSEVDVAHPETDNASETLLEDSCEVKAEKDYDHIELKEQSSNTEVFSEYSMTDNADYTDLSERKTLENPCSDYDHANLN